LQVQKIWFFLKISELQQPNFSETRENKEFKKFRLTLGLNKNDKQATKEIIEKCEKIMFLVQDSESLFLLHLNFN